MGVEEFVTFKLRWILALAALLVGTPVGAWAQGGSPDRVEVFGSGGLHTLWDDESSIGTGAAIGGGVSIALTDTIRIRGRVMRSSNERNFESGVMFENDATRYTADLLWQPSSATHAPYFGVGAGGFSYTRISRFPSGPAMTFTRTDTDTIFGGLAGFTAVATDRFRLAPEVSLWWSRPSYFIVIEVGVVASYRF